jgi:hypothetical protein
MTTVLALAALAVVAAAAVTVKQLRGAIATGAPAAAREPRAVIEPAWTAFVRGL